MDRDLFLEFGFDNHGCLGTLVSVSTAAGYGKPYKMPVDLIDCLAIELFNIEFGHGYRGFEP